MADPSAQREVIPQASQPSNLSFSSNPQHPAFHYPHVYLDPVAAAAFYQQQQHRPTPHPPTSQPASSQPPQQHAPRTTPQHPYYIPDMATVALQQMQLQAMLQLQAHHPHAHANPQRHAATPRPHHAVPHHTTATSPSSVPAVLPIPPHIAPSLAASQSVLPHHALPTLPDTPHAIPLPIVPDAQMASAYRIGRYTPAERKIRLERYREKRAQRNYNRRVKYNCRKQIADKRRRVQGRFVKREEEIALAAATETTAYPNGAIEQHRSDATDATEDETKLQHPESSGSASSVRQIDIPQNGGPDDGGGEGESFCEQSDHMMQAFR